MANKIKKWKNKIKNLRRDVYALYLAYKDKRVRWYVKAFIVCVVAYALSPIDLIPDFIPVIGYIDDLIIVPAGIYLALKMIPAEIMSECRRKAQRILNKPLHKSYGAAIVIVLVWIAILILIVSAVIKAVKK